MLKTSTSTSNPIVLIGVAVLLVTALGAVAYIKLAPVGPNNQISVLDYPNVIHSDSYWSPIDECSDVGLTEVAGCRQANVPSLQYSINRANEPITLDSVSHSDQPSADAPQVSEKPSVGDLPILHLVDKASPVIATGR